MHVNKTQLARNKKWNYESKCGSTILFNKDDIFTIHKLVEDNFKQWQEASFPLYTVQSTLLETQFSLYNNNHLPPL